MTSTASDISQNARDYARIEAAILYLEEHFRDQPELGEVAEAAGLSPHHFQRLFRRWAGISPKRFGQYLTLDYAKDQLEGSASILDAAYDAGLSGPSRLHDLFVTYEAMSPGAFKRRGEGVEIAYGRTSEPLRSLLRRTDLSAASVRWASPTESANATATQTPSGPSSSVAGPPRASTRIVPLPLTSQRAFSASAQQTARHSAWLSPAPTSNSRSGRHCCAFPAAASPPTTRSRKRWGCRVRPARWAAPLPPTRSPT